jgi:hypothetical protein
MAGVFLYEPTGVFEGVLQEDMINTLMRVKRPFIDVLYSDFFDKEKNYPLTYVPMHLMCLPLRKGAKILARFSQDSEMYPVLYKLADQNLDTEFIKDDQQIAIPETKDLVEWPVKQNTLSVIKLSDTSWIVTTNSVKSDASGKDSGEDKDGYTIIHRGSQTILLGSKQFIVGTENIGFVAKDKYEIEVTDGVYTALVKKLISFESTDDGFDVLTKKVINFETSDEGYSLKTKKDITQESSEGAFSLKVNKDILQEAQTGSFSLKAQKDITQEATTGAFGIQAKAGKLTLKGQNGAELDGAAAKVVIKTIAINMGMVLDTFLLQLSTVQPSTMGSPAAHVFNPGIISAIQTAKSQLKMLLG